MYGWPTSMGPLGCSSIGCATRSPAGTRAPPNCGSRWRARSCPAAATPTTTCTTAIRRPAPRPPTSMQSSTWRTISKTESYQSSFWSLPAEPRPSLRPLARRSSMAVRAMATRPSSCQRTACRSVASSPSGRSPSLRAEPPAAARPPRPSYSGLSKACLTRR